MRILLGLLLTMPILFLPKTTAQHWQQVGKNGPNNFVYSLYGDSIMNKLFIGGPFRFFDSLYVGGYAAWNGQNIQGIGDSIQCDGACSKPETIVRYGDYIYFGFGNEQFFFHDFNGICRWDGLNWSGLEGSDLNTSSGAPGLGKGLALIDGKLYVTGTFSFVDGVQATSIAIWDNNNWEELIIPGLDFALMSDCVKFNDKYYFAGNMVYEYDGGFYSDIIEYDGQNWYPIGGGIHGPSADLRDLIVYKNELYIAGYMKASDGNAGDKILKFHNGEWQKVGNVGRGGGAINDMEIWNDELYVCGPFDYIEDDIPANGIAKWDGEKWCSLGDTFNAGLICLEVWNNELYIGGGFNKINEDTIIGIAKWIGGDYVHECGEPVTASSPPPVEKNLLRLYPNPISTNLLTAEYPDWPDESISVSVVNSMGIPVLIQVVNMSGGKALITLPELLSPGYYTVSLWCERRGERVVQRLVRM
jgi:hypothetical protein